MEIVYTHVQQRRFFGSPCCFSDVGPHLIVDIDPNPELKKQFVQIPNVAKESHCSKDMSLHEVNTDQRQTDSTGMNHMVGGWPADVEYKDKDHVTRFTKRIQKEESFIDSVKLLGEQVEMILMENNSINIFEEYFADELHFGNDDMQFKTRNVFRDLCDTKRKVLDLSWSLDGSKITGAYSIDEIHLSTSNSNCECYIWDIENFNIPYCTLNPNASLNVVEYSPRDLELLLGGYGNGQIGLWDARIGDRAQQTTPINVSHKESVSDITWITSKSGFEFVSAARDGKLYSWDSRNMVQPNLSMPLTQQSDQNTCYNITCLEYDSTLPNRLMVGVEEGTVLSCNRKYKDPSEIITGSYPSRTGPVLDISRNLFFPKLFAACSSYGVEVWSEDLTESPMINLKSQKGYVTDAIWCQNHPSFLLVTKSTGHLELWDIIIKHHYPVLSVKLETEGLLRLNHKQHSNEVACSTPNGCILLIEIPEYTAFSLKQEKNLMAAMIDREGKRERTLEGITREVKARKEKHPENQVDLNNSNLLGSMEEENNFLEEFASNFNSDFQDEDLKDENEETLFDLHFVDNLKKVSQAC